MARYIVLLWLVGCSTDGAGDDDHPPPPPEDLDDDQGDDAMTDREECELAMARGSCPSSWAWFYHDGPKTSDDGFVELADLGKPICDGRGVYADSESVQQALGSRPAVGVTTVSNSECYVVCLPRCSPTSICWSEMSDGEQCANACMGDGPTEDECTELVAECLGEDAATCEG